MPIWIYIVLILGVCVVCYFIIRPLQVFSNKEFLISHGFVLLGLGLISAWLIYNQHLFEDIAMLMGGIWAVAGGVCFMMSYSLRSRKKGHQG
jgi:hypothetical protein